jgi:hypothetical protein
MSFAVITCVDDPLLHFQPFVVKVVVVLPPVVVIVGVFSGDSDGMSATLFPRPNQ